MALVSQPPYTFCCLLPLESNATCRAIQLSLTCGRERFFASLALFDVPNLVVLVLCHEYGVKRLYVLCEISACLPFPHEITRFITGDTYTIIVVGTFLLRLSFKLIRHLVHLLSVLRVRIAAHEI